MAVFWKKWIAHIKRNFFTRRFIKYAVVGTVNTIDTALFSALLAVVIQKNISGILGYWISLSIGYLLNCAFVFPRRPSALGYLKYLLSYVPNFIIYFLMSTITISVFGWPTFLATALAAVAGVPVTFLILKIFAFGMPAAKGKTRDDCTNP